MPFARILSLFAILPTLLVLPTPAAKWTCEPNHFAAKPDNEAVGACHGGVAVDRAGNVYVSTDTPRGILVYDKDGKYVSHIGPTLIHGLYLQREADGEYLYCARPSAHEVSKIKTDGTVAWTMGYPPESNIYTKAEEYNPTNIVALPDGTIFVADGYGKKWIHKYDKDRKYVKSFGGPGTKTPAEDGKFNTCHGLAVDRGGGKPSLIVCNRESGRVERWDTDGNLVKVLQRDLRMPAAAQVNREYIAVAELKGRVTILDKEGAIVAQLGDNPKEDQRANYGLEPEKWTEAIVNSPHGISFDRQGNVVVSEWSKFGRVHLFAAQK